MSLSLVTITHPVDPGAEIPFIGGRCPLTQVTVETWKVRHIEAMGFGVEIHEEPYDPIAVADKKAAELAGAIASATPVVETEPEAPVTETSTEDETVTETTAVVEDQTPPQELESGSETSQEAAPPAEGEGESESEGLTEEELAALRARVEALATKADADALIAEYGIQLDPVPSKLKDIKAQLLAMIDAPAE